MPDTILGGDFTIHYDSDGSQKRIEWTGSSDGTRTLNELYSAIQDLFDEPAQMDELVPIRADTPDIYRLQNQWFIDDTSVEHLTGGSLFSSDWIDAGVSEDVLVIGFTATTAFTSASIGRTILGGTTADTGTILDFNTLRNLVWIRPVDPLVSTGDEFDNGVEGYTISNDSFDQVWGVDDTPSDNEFVDETADANSATNADWGVFTFAGASAIGDYVALGFRQPFSRVTFDNLNGTAGTVGAGTWEYWDGSAWTALAGVTDGTTGFTIAVVDGQDLTFTVPTDWAARVINGSASLYYIRFSLSAAYTVHPIYDQGFIGDDAAGSFSGHNRHGAASAAGESAWVGLTSIGTIETDSHVYVFQENPDEIIQSFFERRVLKTKGTDDYWGDGQIDILLKVKEADSVFGERPAAAATALGIASFFVRQLTKTYTDFVATSLATAGGNTVVPFSSADDLNNTLGVRNLVWDGGDAATTLADEELLYNVGTTTVGNFDAGVAEENGVGFTDDTTDLNDSGASDVAVYPATASNNDAFYFGKDNVFRLMLLDVGTAHNGTTSTQVWEYWDGTAWQTLTVTDDTDAGNGAFDTTGRGLITWTPPTDWARTTVTSQADERALFYVRIRLSVTGDLTTEPLLSIGWVGGELQLKARVADTGIVTPGGAAGNADYYLLGEPITDFVDNDVFVALTTAAGSRKNADIAGGPTNVNAPTDTGITVVFGQTTEDINNGNGARPYSVRIDPNSVAILRTYERMKFITRRGSTEALLIQDGEEYRGNELQVEYTGQAGGNFVEGMKVYDQTSKAEGIVVGDHDDGATGDLQLKAVRGTFGTNVVSDMNGTSQTLAAALQVTDIGPVIVDETADAISVGGADVDPFPAAEATADYFAIGAAFPFSKVSIDISTSGTVGTGIWEYWNGAAWVTLESQGNFADATTDLTAATGFRDLDFDPPNDWHAMTIEDSTAGFGSYYYIRLRVTGVYTINPVLQEVQILDLVTATIASTRTITPASAAPFGTFAGGTFFGAPGVALTIANLIAADVQAFQLIDDDGTTQIPPNTVSVEVTQLLSGDSVAVYRRTGSAIAKTAFTLNGNHALNTFTITVNEAIDSSYPASGKLRIVDSSGAEFRYRYNSFSGSVFTLDADSNNDTATGGDADTLTDTGATFIADGVEVGDYVYNITETQFVRVLAVVDTQNLTTEALTGGATWSGDTYDINSTVLAHQANDNVYVPFIERIADATEELAQLVYTSDIDIRVVVRRTAATAILPFSQDTSIISTGRSVPTIRTPDTIFTP